MDWLNCYRLCGVFILSTVILISGCEDSAQESSTAQEVTAQIQKVDQSNQRAFVVQMVTEYIQRSTDLTEQYMQFRKTEDADGFISYRNRFWTPGYIDSKTRYEDIFYKQKAYFYRNQLAELFDYYFALQKLALHLKHSIQNRDWELEKQALEKLKKDRAAMQEFLAVKQ